ncbi:transporter mfs2 [Lecanosticta acicola]|uniref:Cercosporin MFS transporter CTB4 n=1 Tax=Lecanosticta acicola TaxID=111012 RepID=A0AAI9E7F7_9PEZI|nr:transporter mfs2 [Lecanosticta acicola]
MAQDEENRDSAERQRYDDETQPLLQRGHTDGGEGGDSRELLRFEENDSENPRQWSYTSKMLNVATIAAMAILSPLASSMFTPGISQIAEGLDTTEDSVIACTTGFVVMLGVGPLVLAPLSETFGRRIMYLSCFSIFAILQIPSALSPNIGTLVATRTLAGFFGSVGIANGGGSLSDMFEPSQRASVFGWYLLGPLLGPTLGPLFGGVIVQRLNWRWIFWILTIICVVNTSAAYFLLKESYPPIILAQRRSRLEKEANTSNKYRFDGEDPRPLWIKLRYSLTRPLRILVQPIVLTMSTYQAILFATTYSIYTNMQPIYQGEYGFNTEQVGLLYLGPGLGFLFSVWFLVPRIDTIYNALAARNNGKGRPEYRLPLANIGSVFIPAALFWFAWTVQSHRPWYVSIISTFFYGIGQVTILNCTTNYYIDCFEKYAASAIAAGAVFRSVIGGIVPLFAPTLFHQLGYGWGISVFGFLSLAIAPAPLTFYLTGAWVRERFWVEL